MASKRDYLRSKRGAALGGRLRRASDRIDREAAAVYRALGVDFDQRWFGVLNQLALDGDRSVGEIAAALGTSHAAVSQVRAALERAGLVERADSGGDARRRALRLSGEGREVAARLKGLWAAMEAAARRLDREAGGLASALDALEEALSRRSLVDRVGDEIARARRSGG